jgi:hypothetical protein
MCIVNIVTPSFLSAQPLQLVSADGFITQISGNILHMGVLSVQMQDATECSTYDTAYAAWTHDLKIRKESVPCATLPLVVGTYVHVQGRRGESGVLKADTLALDDPWTVAKVQQTGWGPLRARQKPWLRKLSSLSGGPLNGKFAGGSFLQECPEGITSKNGTAVNVWINGFPLLATKSTALSMGTRSISSASMVRIATDNSGNMPVFPRLPSRIPVAFPATNSLIAGKFVAYKGKQRADGRMVAYSMDIFSGASLKSSIASLEVTKPQVIEPNYKAQTPGRISYGAGNAIEIIPNRAIQEYVRRIGTDLIPRYQRVMDDTDDQKIDFRFYVVRPFHNVDKNGFVQIDGTIRQVSSAEWRAGIRSPFVLPTGHALVNGIVEMPDGMILIPETFLNRLQSDAQLAFALSAAVQCIVQRLQSIAVAEMKPSFGNYGMPSVGIGYVESMLALRIGIRQMYLAGYDIREAPFAWAVAQGKPVNNPVIDSKHADKEIPWYAAYAFNYISQYYRDVDYSKLKRGEKDYQQFLQELRKADPEAFAPQKAVSGQTAKVH